MVVDLLELLEALHTDGVEISSIGDKLEEEVLGVDILSGGWVDSGKGNG